MHSYLVGTTYINIIYLLKNMFYNNSFRPLEQIPKYCLALKVSNVLTTPLPLTCSSVAHQTPSSGQLPHPHHGVHSRGQQVLGGKERRESQMLETTNMLHKLSKC